MTETKKTPLRCILVDKGDTPRFRPFAEGGKTSSESANIDDFREPKERLEESDAIKINFQSARPGGHHERKRLKDCEALLEPLGLGWHNTSELARMLGWSRGRVRNAIRAMRAAVEHERRIGEHGAEEDRWRLKERR